MREIRRQPTNPWPQRQPAPDHLARIADALEGILEALVGFRDAIPTDDYTHHTLMHEDNQRPPQDNQRPQEHRPQPQDHKHGV